MYKSHRNIVQLKQTAYSLKAWTLVEEKIYPFLKLPKKKHLRKCNDSEVEPVPWVSKESKIF